MDATSASAPVHSSWIGSFFRVEERHSTLSREFIAGLTTFGAMSYIVVVNPAIVSATGASMHSLIIATALASMIGTLIMAFWANLPIALAPGMGSNIIFAQVVVLQMGVSFKTALTMVLIGAVLFTILSLTRWREKIVQAFPASIRIGLQCSIGIFIAYLGLKDGGLLSLSAQGASFGKLTDPAVLLALTGVLGIPILIALRVPAALLVSIIILTAAGMFLHHVDGTPLTVLPSHAVDLPTFPSELFLAFDFGDFFQHFWLVLPITLYFFLSDFFGATATLIGVTRRANLMDEQGRIPNSRQAYGADGIATIIGSALGTSTIAAYIESAAGVEAGGRTGLTSVVVAVLFGLSLFFWPLIAVVPAQATAPALIFVGVLMLEGVRDLDISEPENAMPPLLMLLVTVVTTDLIMALSIACFVYTLVVFARRKWELLTPMLLGLDVVFVIYAVLTTKAL